MALVYATITPGETSVAIGTSAILSRLVVTGTAAEFTSEAPTLNTGQFGYETDSGQFKIGDGSTAWASLAYFAPPGGEGGGGASSGAAAPASAPSEEGEIYIETTNDRFYIATGTATSADWKRVTLQADLDALYTSSALDPSSTPTVVGMRHINTSTKTAWVSVGTGSSADWRRDDSRIIIGVTAPTADEDTADGYLVGDRWLYLTRMWTCTDNSAAAAVWREIGLTTAQLASLVLADSALQEADATPLYTFGADETGAAITASMDHHGVITELTHATPVFTVPPQASETWAAETAIYLICDNDFVVKGGAAVAISGITAGAGWDVTGGPQMVALLRKAENDWRIFADAVPA
jgi:hypothetical protein